MTSLPLAWTLWAVALWTAGSSQILQHGPMELRYPKISAQETIECNCVNVSCDSTTVHWFRSTSSHSNLQYLGRCNNAERVIYGPHVEQTRFKMGKRGAMSFVLRIVSVQEEDKGIYSCVLKDKSNKEIWKPGTALLPGVIPPTSPPKTKPKPPVKSVCRCLKKNLPRDGCDTMVLWPLVGLTAGLALALICTLYYFSRLPKKCHHHFAKMRQVT